MESTYDANRIANIDITDIHKSGGPSTVIFKGYLYCFHRCGRHNYLFYNKFDGCQWVRYEKLNKTQLSESPSAVVFRNRLYCFYQSTFRGQLKYNIFNGKEWDTEK